MTTPTPTTSFPPTTANGTTTFYQPLTTHFSAPEACSTYLLADEYVDAFNNNRTSIDALTAWSPWYALYANDSAKCLPEAVLSSETEFQSWFSASLSSLLITTSTTATERSTTLFAPFYCVDGWQAAWSSVLAGNESVTESVCCPTFYNAAINTIGLGDYNGVDVTTRTIQCVSPIMKDVQNPELTYVTLTTDVSNGSTITSALTHSTELATSLTVTAVAYTGYNIANPTDAPDDDDGWTYHKPGLNVGQKVGIGVGVGAGVVIILAVVGAWFLRRRRRRGVDAKGIEAEAAAKFSARDKKDSGEGQSGEDGLLKSGLKADGPAEMQGDGSFGIMQELHNGVDRPELMGSGQVFAQELEGSYEWPVPEVDGGTAAPAQELDAGLPAPEDQKVDAPGTAEETQTDSAGAGRK
ncbi:hypothetical protein BJX65DRAFT_311893 [Aspergillus insuetus]